MWKWKALLFYFTYSMLCVSAFQEQSFVVQRQQWIHISVTINAPRVICTLFVKTVMNINHHVIRIVNVLMEKLAAKHNALRHLVVNAKVFYEFINQKWSTLIISIGQCPPQDISSCKHGFKCEIGMYGGCYDCQCLPDVCGYSDDFVVSLNIKIIIVYSWTIKLNLF